MAKVKREITHTAADLVESLKLSVPIANAETGVHEMQRIGPSDPLWGDELAKRTVSTARGDKFDLDKVGQLKSTKERASVESEIVAARTDAAREILREFVEAVDQYSERTWKGPTYWAYARYIADAFEQILDGTDPAFALGIKSSKAGRRKGRVSHDPEALAAALNLLIANGLGRKQAKFDLKKYLGVDVRTIERANNANPTYGIYAKRALSGHATKANREFALEVIKGGAAPYAAKIAVILAAR